MAVKLKRSALSAVSLTSMMDMVFLLLIFFLVATRFSEQQSALDMQLPTASEALPLSVQPQEIFVNIDRDGQYFIDGQFRLAEELEHALRQAAANNPLTQTVVIRADRSADWQAVATAINLCKKVGINDYTALMKDE
jgi:biopolymer transport protein ExbD